MDKDCSSALPFQKVRWRYSGPRGSRRAKPMIRWQEMAGVWQAFQRSFKMLSYIGAWDPWCGHNETRDAWRVTVTWVWSAVLSRVNFLLFYMPSLFLIFTPIIVPPLDYDLLHTSLSSYGVKPSREISHLILYDQLLSSSWYIVIAKSMLIKWLNI